MEVMTESRFRMALNLFDNAPWQQIPRFAAECLNNKHGQVPNDHSVDFHINGRKARLTLLPGTFYPTKTSPPMRRYLGVNEQLVEQALIHHAIAFAGRRQIPLDVSGFITFTVNALGRQLKAMGSTLSNTQIRQALDVLSSAVITLSYGDDLALDSRYTLLSSFGRNNQSTAPGNNGHDIWCGKVHALTAQSMLRLEARQFWIGQLQDYSPVGAALVRHIHYVETRVSEKQPYTFMLQEMKGVTAGLNHVRLAGSMQAVRTELERMQVHGYLASFTVEEIFPRMRGRGRPVPIDCRVTLFPGPQWIKNMKAGPRLQGITE